MTVIPSKTIPILGENRFLNSNELYVEIKKVYFGFNSFIC
ncbi:hypothetical protein EMIT0210MI2_13000 [Priestia megaterium]